MRVDCGCVWELAPSRNSLAVLRGKEFLVDQPTVAKVYKNNLDVDKAHWEYS
jgi:hypothetical protein